MTTSTATELDEAKYVDLTTFKRDGSKVTTPVWLAPSDNGYFVTTGKPTGKYKRILNNSSVEVAACDARGHLRPGTTTYKGTARILDADGTRSAEAAIKKRYGFMVPLMGAVYATRAKLQRKDFGPIVGLEITIDTDD